MATLKINGNYLTTLKISCSLQTNLEGRLLKKEVKLNFPFSDFHSQVLSSFEFEYISGIPRSSINMSAKGNNIRILLQNIIQCGGSHKEQAEKYQKLFSIL